MPNHTLKEFCDFVPEEGETHWEFWGFDNEEELREILREFKRLIFTYELDFLEVIRKPATVKFYDLDFDLQVALEKEEGIDYVFSLGRKLEWLQYKPGEFICIWDIRYIKCR